MDRVPPMAPGSWRWRVCLWSGWALILICVYFAVFAICIGDGAHLWMTPFVGGWVTGYVLRALVAARHEIIRRRK